MRTSPITFACHTAKTSVLHCANDCILCDISFLIRKLNIYGNQNNIPIWDNFSIPSWYNNVKVFNAKKRKNYAI